MKAPRVAVIAGLVTVVAGCGGSHARAEKAAPPPAPGPAKLAEIRQVVLNVAAHKGEPSPTRAVLVPTTRRLAEVVDVDMAVRDAPVYFVLVHGDFEPGGSLLSVTIDPRTNQAIETGLPGAPPDPSSLGEPQPLPLGS
jgi:hypothetical protein